MNSFKCLGLLTVLGLTAPNLCRIEAALFINEIEVNTENDGPNSSDSGKEFFEILSDAGAESLAGLTFVVIEGEGGARGTIDQALSLDSFSTGSNGLFLWRDSSAVLSPAPHTDTVVNVADFVPDLENGSNTFVLVRDFNGSVGDDLDTDDDGTLDGTLPWTEVLDAVGALDSTTTDSVYGSQLGFVDFPNVSYAADSLVRLSNGGGWVAADIDEAISGYPGPYPLDDTQAMFLDGTLFIPSTTLTFNTLSPGNVNPALVPEPHTVALLGLGMIVFATSHKSRRRKLGS